MSTKQIVMTAITGAILLAAAGAQARDDHHRGHGYKHHGHHRKHMSHHYAHRVVVRPAPVYYYDYAPAPVYYPPQPVYYVPPRPQVVLPGPVIYGSLPIGDARVRIGIQF